MKKTLILILVLSFFFASGLCGEEKTTKTADTDIGRYQIVSMKNADQDAIFLLDTKTGKCWQGKLEVFQDIEGKLHFMDTYYFTETHIDTLHKTAAHERNAQSITITDKPVDFSDLIPEGKKTNTATDLTGTK